MPRTSSRVVPRSSLETVRRALSQKLAKLQASGLQTDRKKAFKLESKIRRLDREIAQPRLL